MAKLAADPLVESLLLLHDLHPVPVADRVRRAIEAVMPQLGEQRFDPLARPSRIVACGHQPSLSLAFTACAS